MWHQISASSPTGAKTTSSCRAKSWIAGGGRETASSRGASYIAERAKEGTRAAKWCCSGHFVSSVAADVERARGGVRIAFRPSICALRMLVGGNDPRCATLNDALPHHTKDDYLPGHLATPPTASVSLISYTWAPSAFPHSMLSAGRRHQPIIPTKLMPRPLGKNDTTYFSLLPITSVLSSLCTGMVKSELSSSEKSSSG